MSDSEDARTILFVEDEPMVRNLGIRILRSKGFNVIDAENGSDGIEAFRNSGEPIDLVITDVIMPQLNGPDMVTKLREMDPDLKVIFVSGYTPNECEVQARLDQRTNFLQKPYSASSLWRMIRLLDGDYNSEEE